jgi:hypothetical protein
MSLQLGQAFAGGIRRVLTRTGAVLFAVLLAMQFLIQTSINTAVLGLFPPEVTAQLGEQLGLTLPVSWRVATALFLLVMVLSAAYFVALARALVRPMAELSTLPRELYTRRIGRSTLSVIGGGIVVWIAVMIGLMLLFLPGIYLAACFIFFAFEVAVADERAIDAIKRSWNRSQGNRLKLSIIVVLSGVIGAVIGVVGTVFDLAGSPVVGEILANFISTVLFVLLYGIIADAYVQLSGDHGGPGRPDTAGPGRVDSGVAPGRS